MTSPVNTTFVSGSQITSTWLNGANDHVNDLETDAHTAANITNVPSGIVTGTNVQDAIDELASRSFAIVSIVDYGAVGDNTTDCTSAIQDALDNNTSVYVPAGIFKTTSTLTIPEGVTLFGTGSIHYTGTGHAINVTGDDVTIEGVTIYGDYSGTYSSGSIGIYCSQTTYSPTLNVVWTNRLKFKNLTIYNFGGYGIRGDWWNTFEISGCYIHDCGYAGMVITSPRYGRIINNNIYNITPGVTNSGYGISLSRNKDATIGGVANTPISLADAPVPYDCIIANNTVASISNYVAIDLHSGNNISIIGNNVQACQMGVNLEHASSNSSILATVTNIVISGNTFYGSSSPWYAPCVYVDAQGGYGEIAENLAISGNSFYNYGLSSSSPFPASPQYGGVIYLRSVSGVSISGNSFNTSRGRCVAIYSNSTNVTISGNSVKDLAGSTVSGTTYRNAFDLLATTSQATINNNTANGGSGYVVACSVSPPSGMGLKVGADNLAYGGITMATSSTKLLLKGGSFIMSPRVMVTWDASGVVRYSAFDDINYTDADISITKNTTGDFTVTWPSGTFGDAVVSAMFTGAEGTNVYTSQVTTSNATTARCKTYNTSGALVDCSENSLLVWGK